MNNFSFTGRLTRHAELKSTGQGLSILSFSVANNTGYGDRQKTNFVNCTLFGKRAEGRLQDYLKKGQEVAVTGELNLNTFTKNDGQPSSSLECIVNSVDLIGGRQVVENNTQNKTGTLPARQLSPEPLPDDDIPF